ncbi:MAG TPA: hypothetical protein VFG79_18230 [Solirubrobacter sp.]|nr:hypothetical protein [Solirubrobacter sp.]
MIVVGAGTMERRRRRRPAETVWVTRISAIDASPVGDDASAWLRDAVVPEASEALLWRFLSAWRVASADPFAADADVGRAMAVRVGYGTGDEVAEGRWTEARELEVPPVASARRSRHRPVERLAALLAARDAVLACEELTLRARADLSRGRSREAALQLEAALTAALAELAGWVSYGDVAARVAELARLRDGVAAAAAAAREGSLEAAHVDAVRTALERLEAALRARAIFAAEAE